MLYLKNLDPRVSVDDLQAVFGGVTSSKPCIRVMTGRMKGQAFAEFECELNKTNNTKYLPYSWLKLTGEKKFNFYKHVI